MLRETIGQNLKAQRQKLGLTQNEAAKRCGMPVKTYGRIERGKENTTLETLEKITLGLGTTIQQLLTETIDEAN